MSRPDLERAIRSLAATASPTPLPDADLIWQRAAVRARWRQCELATRSIRVAERAACIVCAVTGTAWFSSSRCARASRRCSVRRTQRWHGCWEWRLRRPQRSPWFWSGRCRRKNRPRVNPFTTLPRPRQLHRQLGCPRDGRLHVRVHGAAYGQAVGRFHDKDFARPPGPGGASVPEGMLSHARRATSPAHHVAPDAPPASVMHPQAGRIRHVCHPNPCHGVRS